MIRRVAWLAATALGLFAGGFVLHFPGSFGEPDWQPAAMIFGFILGFLTGVAVGLLQWAALLLPKGPGSRLALAMGVGIGVTHAFFDGAPGSVGRTFVAIVSALAMTAAFALILRERRPAALAVCFAGWTGGLLVAAAVTSTLGMPWSETPVGWSMEHAVQGLIAGLIWGAATGWIGLPDMLSRPGEIPSGSGEGRPASAS